MEDFYGRNFAQGDSQARPDDNAGGGPESDNVTYDTNMTRRQGSDGVHTLPANGYSDPESTRQGVTSGGHTRSIGEGRAGEGAGPMQHMQQIPCGFANGSVTGFDHGNDDSTGGGSGNMAQTLMNANAMQQQANLTLMTQMLNTNPMYAMMMSNAVAAASASSPLQQPASPMGMNFSGGIMSQSPLTATPQDQNAMAMMQSALNPALIMPGAQMLPGTMMNPMMQNMQRSSQNEAIHHDGRSGGVNPSSIGDSSGHAFSRTNPADMAGQTPNNPYQNMSGHSNMSQPRRPSLSQQGSHRGSGQHDSAQQSPTVFRFPSPVDGQVPPLVPIMQNSYPESSNDSPAFATSGIRMNTTHDSYRNVYSSTGFDMLTVLMRVATRKNPTINIGNVDLSCAFVVCDTTHHDIPIVYCSENFERLSGYTKHEILGRNCRFLQAPSGRVEAGVKRKYVDDDVVLHLKNAVNSRSEAQVSVINYRKGGQPFMNMLTLIPIPYDTDEIKYYVGFQVDLVEQPHSITKKNPNGTYAINYQRGLQMPRYIFTGQDRHRPRIDSGQTIPRDEVSTVLSTIGSGESDLSRRIWDKVLLENTDDVIFVLSLKGLFLYLSPSCNRVLEYDPNELMGAALSSVCHPSDIVPVTRELKDTTTGTVVSAVFRIRRKENGYMWFEGRGSLSVEQGKGRKSIVLVGRERPVYTLKKTDLMANGAIGENEVWTKLSTSGMFLYVSSSIRALLDKQPNELVGLSIQSLMRPDSRSEFGRVLEIARSGKRAQTKHELINRRGQVLQAFSTVHPGDASQGAKPTFLIAQTRLLKYTRPTPPGTNSQRPLPNPANSSTAQQLGSTPPNRHLTSSRPSSSTSLPSPSQYMSTFETASTIAGGDALPLGHQDSALADDLNLFDELKTTRSTSWQYELRQMEKRNRLLAEELQGLLAAKKKRKRRKPGVLEKECANCHTKQTPEWRRGPSGNRDLCNSCGLRWAKQQGRISPRTTSHRSGASGGSPGSGGSPPSRGSGCSEPRDESSRVLRDQPDAQQRRKSASAAPAVGEKEHNGRVERSRPGPKSIDEALAQIKQPQKHEDLSPLQVTAGQSMASPPALKAAKVRDDSESPTSPGAFRTSIPTKVEEEDE